MCARFPKERRPRRRTRPPSSSKTRYRPPSSSDSWQACRISRGHSAVRRRAGLTRVLVNVVPHAAGRDARTPGENAACETGGHGGECPRRRRGARGRSGSVYEESKASGSRQTGTNALATEAAGTHRTRARCRATPRLATPRIFRLLGPHPCRPILCSLVSPSRSPADLSRNSGVVSTRGTASSEQALSVSPVLKDLSVFFSSLVSLSCVLWL